MKQIKIFVSLILCLWGVAISADQIKMVSESFPPYEYAEDGEIKGFTVDLMKHLLSKTGHQGKTQLLPWARAYKMALNESHVLVHRMTRSEAREPLFKWIGKVSPRITALFKLKERKDIQLEKLDDAKRYEIGIVNNQSQGKYLLKHGFEEEVNVFSVPIDELNVKKLFNNRIDMIIMLEQVLQWRTKKLGYDFTKLERALTVDAKSEYHMAFSQQTPDVIVEQFREALADLKKDGTFEQLWKKYF